MRRILVIDDEEDIRVLLRDVFQEKGYNVVEAANGEAGLRIFQTMPVDLVMTDILMPEKEGLSTIMDLKKTNPKLKIIAMSGGTLKSGHYLNVALKFGADKVLEKPFHLQTVIQAVEELLP
jgi:DNA-binding response OmpR family regulator